MREYKISPKTLIDIIEKIPSEKWDLVMDELKVILQHTRLSFDSVNILSKTAKSKEKTKAHLSDPLIWKDDGKGEIEVNHYLNSQSLFTSKEKINES